MTKQKWEFTKIQWIFLIIMASITIFLFTVNVYLLFQMNNNEINSPPVNETTPTLIIYKTPTELTNTPHQITLPVPTLLSRTSPALLLTPTKVFIDQTPSSIPIVISTPTTTPPPQFFTNDWDGKTNQWKWFSTKGNDNLWDVYNEAGVLVFSLLGKETNAYFIYNPWEYNKVEVSTLIEVRSPTKSTTTIICNYTEQKGWYEFNFGTNGLWELRAHDTYGKTGYISLSSGGSLAIHTGEGINEYSAICEGNHLTFSINGTQVLDFTDKLLKFQQGKIGVGVFSYSEVPVLVESAWVKISQP